MKRVVFVVVFIISLLAINTLVTSIVSLWQKQSLLTSYYTELEKERLEYEKLLEKEAIVKDPLFIEKEARNKLMMVRSNEQEVIIPYGSVMGESVTQTSNSSKPNWQVWMDLFF